MHYNIIDEPWLHIEYIDTRTNTLSVRQVLQQAQAIKRLTTPQYNGNKFFLYEYCAMEFLTNLILAAYYKPEYSFAPKRTRWKQDLYYNGLYSDVIQQYLKQYYTRFDLFDEKHPFLQDTTSTLLTTENQDNSFIALLNPVAPGKNNPVFGPWRARGTNDDILGGYKISLEEYPYLLLYHNSIAPSPMPAHYIKCLRGSAGIFIIPKGKNLCETILKNCGRLSNSDRPNADNPDTFFDRPIWELNHPSEAYQYPPDTAYKNRLLCAYYPSKSLKGQTDDNATVYINVPKKVTVNTVYPCRKNVAPTLEKLYIQTDINTVRNTKPKKSNDNNASEEPNQYCYETYNDKPAWLILIAATSYITNDKVACGILDEQDELPCSATVYYRCFDDKKVNILQSGKLDIPDNIDITALINNDSRQKMLDIQKIIYDNKKSKKTCGIRLLYRTALVGMQYNKSTVQSLMSDYDSWIGDYILHKYIPNLSSPDCYETGKHDIINETLKRLNDMMIHTRHICEGVKQCKELMKMITRKDKQNADN